MKRLLLATLLLLSLEATYAAHIKGGFFTYEYLGPGIVNPAHLRYRVTLTVYMICSAEGNPGQLSNPINFSVFNGGNNQFIQDVSVPITSQFRLGKVADEPCITGDQRKCYYYIVVYDMPSMELPAAPNGYTIAYQRCCRIPGIQNIVGSGTVGNTFSIKIPGSTAPQNAQTNSSPKFLVNDTAVVCSGSYFQYSFSATDPDPDDSLSYEFCAAITGGSQLDPAPTTSSNPPFPSVPYSLPFSGSQPMGAGVTIDPRTGLISGVAPNSSGEYVLSVCVNEFKEGVWIGSTRKELHIEVGDCESIGANLSPTYITCDGFSWTFSNSGDQSQITSYNWFFGDPASGANDSSSLASPTHLFSDTGIYTVTLIVNRGDPCADTATTLMKVYPGFFPDFNNVGICLTSPVQFQDATTTAYGVVDSWKWNFGDLSTLADTSRAQNAPWTYGTIGPKDVTLIATNSKGCTDTITKTVTIIDKPPITMAFRDTLICVPDAVQLQASGTGSFSWTPLTNIINANTGTPTVNPVSTTTYHVQLNEQGCVNTDSVRVRVVSFVTLNAMPDTTICLSDSVRLHATSDGLQFLWSPAATLDDPTIKDPLATPVANSTPYRIEARIGSCTAEDFVTVTAIPYPVANAGVDTVICYNHPAYLQGAHNGVSFEWSPASSLVNANTLTPTAYPPRTTEYVLSVYSDQGCPKAGNDTVLVRVMPKVEAFAGNDTLVIVNQPLQFNAQGGVTYQWSPATALDDPSIQNPVGVYGADMDSIRYMVVAADSIGCTDSAFVKVTVFKTNPYVFVPTAFTPNGDGLNDFIRPIAVGVKRINYFSIYNRWGELLFKTTINGQGWDGRIKGVPQATNVFVWMVSAVDYLDKPIFLKGTVTLIR